MASQVYWWRATWLSCCAVLWSQVIWRPSRLTGQQNLGSWHQWSSSSYLALFPSNTSSKGTVSSSRTTCLDDMSGQRIVTTTVSGNLSCLPRLAFQLPGLSCCQKSSCILFLFSLALPKTTVLCCLLLPIERSADIFCNNSQHLVRVPLITPFSQS